MSKVLFVLVSLITLVSAIGVVTLPKVLHAALALVFALLGVGCLYALLGAGYLAVVQVMVYVGAISVLIILAVMVSQRSMKQTSSEAFVPHRVVTAAVAGLLFLVLAGVSITSAWPVVSNALPPDTIARLGEAFGGRYLLPFEVASVVLLVSLVGAVYVAREP